MNSVTVAELAAIIAAVLGPTLAFVVASMRYSHLEAVKTRELISDSERSTRKLISDLERATREVISAFEREIRRDMTDTRERLARIEGHFGIAAPPPHEQSDEATGEGADPG